MTKTNSNHPTPSGLSILIINPNTSKHMTTALVPAISSLEYEAQGVTFHYFTSPEPGIPSINSPADAATSASACLPALKPLIAQHDAFLIACYSQHPLVSLLQQEITGLAALDVLAGRVPRRRYVTGIFEASVTASLSVASASGINAGFGIVSTGKVWEAAFDTAVVDFFGGMARRFLGCQTTGLNASELHALPADVVRGKMMEATKLLVGHGRETGVRVQAVCLGCAGMVGLEEAVRTALVEELGSVEGLAVAIVDGVKAGVGELVMLARGGF